MLGAKVRQTIRELGGTMPEKLPMVESIDKIETKHPKQLGKTNTPAKKEKPLTKSRRPVGPK